MITPEIQTNQGWSEVILNRECDISEFYKVAKILENDLHVNFTNKLNDLENFFWDFQYNKHDITIHYNIYLGISLFPTELSEATKLENNTAEEIGHSLFTILYAK